MKEERHFLSKGDVQALLSFGQKLSGIDPSECAAEVSSPCHPSPLVQVQLRADGTVDVHCQCGRPIASFLLADGRSLKTEEHAGIAHAIPIASEKLQ
jgi:hypothetical protein